VSLQVKYSKNYNAAPKSFGPKNIVESRGWWTLQRDKIENSIADFWVFVIYNFDPKLIRYVIIKPQKLSDKLKGIHGEQKSYHIYLSVKKVRKVRKVRTQITCWETRGLQNKAIGNLGANNDNNGDIDCRSFTQYLRWDPVRRKLGLRQKRIMR
ncbi:MAG TPA: hypothetical protein PLQ45_07565, partial [Anaerohalosphaeraceae bacterium]|nr:hypothetical protein [Anaerohalosphaeraceae bacterium]